MKYDRLVSVLFRALDYDETCRAVRATSRSNHPTIRSDPRLRTQESVRGGDRLCPDAPDRGSALRRVPESGGHAARLRGHRLRHAREQGQVAEGSLARRLDLG